jgi:hypothetical protein
MELFLNILWVLIAVAGVGVWRVRWQRQSRIRRPEAWREWTAVACVLVVLFFAVSLTDDLHAELVFLEDCSTSRRYTNCLDCVHSSPQRHTLPAGVGFAIVSRPASAHTFSFESLTPAVVVSVYATPEQNCRYGRAPPIAL